MSDSLRPLDCSTPGLPLLPLGKYLGIELLGLKIVVVQSLNRVRLFATPWTAAHQASLLFTISRSFFKLMSIKLVMPSNHLILCGPLLLLPSIFSNFRVFSNKSALRSRWSKYWSFSISPFNEYSRLVSFRIDWFDYLAVHGIQVFSSKVVQKHQFFGPLYGSALTTIHDYWKYHSFD